MSTENLDKEKEAALARLKELDCILKQVETQRCFSILEKAMKGCSLEIDNCLVGPNEVRDAIKAVLEVVSTPLASIDEGSSEGAVYEIDPLPLYQEISACVEVVGLEEVLKFPSIANTMNSTEPIVSQSRALQHRFLGKKEDDAKEAFMDFYSLLEALSENTKEPIDLTDTTLSFYKLLTATGPGGPAEPREIENPPTTLPELFLRVFGKKS